MGRMLFMKGVAHDYAYYRTGAGAEVDLVVEANFARIAVAIKHTNPRKITHSIA